METARGLQRLRNSSLKNIYLYRNPWSNPSSDVVDAGLVRIVEYWKAIALSGVRESWKLKVVLVGAVKAGKTSLTKGMIHGVPHLCHEDDRTKGVDVHIGEPCKLDAAQKLKVIFWDFAGHSEYYSTHQVFLSNGALHLLVVDIKLFSDEVSSRGELVDVWLDALQCRVPGSSVLVVATKIDRLSSDLEVAVNDLRLRVESHLNAQHNEIEGQWRGLVFHGVKPVTSSSPESLLSLRLKISSLVYSKRDKFPSVGLKHPVSWARASAVLDAKRSGKDPIQQASRIGTAEEYQDENLKAVTAGAKFLHRVDAIDEWRRVVKALNLEKEVESTTWDIFKRKFKRREATEGKGKKAVFKAAVEQMVREGTILDSGEILYLEPIWINELLREILNHDLADATKETFWRAELETFCGNDNGIYYDLKRIHDNFPSTGILTVRYLRFLWRYVTEISDTALFKSLLNIMSYHGVIFPGNPTEDDSENDLNDLNRAELFVPLHLPSSILENDLEEFATLLKHQFRKELVIEIHQSYVPPGLLGLLMGRFLSCKGAKIQKSWNRGVAFTLKEVLVLLYLDMHSHGEENARITVNLFGVRFVSDLAEAMETVEEEIKSMFVERFRGLLFSPKKGYPRDVSDINPFDVRDTTDGSNSAGSMSDIDIVKAVTKRIHGLEAHLDRELSRLFQGLQQLEDKLEDVARSCHRTMVRLNELQSKQLGCPSLVIVRPAAALESGEQKRSLWAMVRGLARRTKKVVCKDMRLCFLCPHDFSEVPCGLDGNGYPFSVTREWVTKIRPALKVTAVVAKVAIRATTGLDVPVSDFLNGAKSYLGDELADRVPESDAIDRALDGSALPAGESTAKDVVGKAYEELERFIEGHECKDKKGYVHFDKLMQVVIDSDGEKVWVSNQNVEAWQAVHT